MGDGKNMPGTTTLPMELQVQDAQRRADAMNAVIKMTTGAVEKDHSAMKPLLHAASTADHFRVLEVAMGNIRGLEVHGSKVKRGNCCVATHEARRLASVARGMAADLEHVADEADSVPRFSEEDVDKLKEHLAGACAYLDHPQLPDSVFVDIQRLRKPRGGV